MMGNYHVRFGGQSMSDALTPTDVFYWNLRFYCLGSSYGARGRYVAERYLFGL